MSPIAEPPVLTLTEVVLIVENDRNVSTRLAKALEPKGITVRVVETIASAQEELKNLLSNNLERLVILLDLMFELHSPEREGLLFHRELRRYPEFDPNRMKVIVLTAASAPNIRTQVLEDGAAKFHAKTGDLEPVLLDILLHVGRRVKTTTSRVEVVDLDPSKLEVEVRYEISKERWFRCILDYDEVPEPARVPGGSFYIDIYKKLTNGRPVTESESRGTDADEDRKALRLLGWTP